MATIFDWLVRGPYLSGNWPEPCPSNSEGLADRSGSFNDWLQGIFQLAQKLELTDRRISELATEGRSNAEIAAALMLPETYIAGRMQALQVWAVVA
jgi:hypothetical protein